MPDAEHQARARLVADLAKHMLSLNTALIGATAIFAPKTSASIWLFSAAILFLLSLLGAFALMWTATLRTRETGEELRRDTLYLVAIVFAILGFTFGLACLIMHLGAHLHP